MVHAKPDGDSAFMVTKVALDSHAGEIAVGRLFSVLSKGDQLYVAGAKRKQSTVCRDVCMEIVLQLKL